MSCILTDESLEISSTPNLLGGLDIVGIRGQENELEGSQGTDSILGGNLNDIIKGGSGFDFIDGKVGNDILNGNRDNDFIIGGDGNDIINGGDGEDLLYGDAGNDVLSGNRGDDQLRGGEGNDTLKGGLGCDQLYGEQGQDTFVLEFFDSVDTIVDFNVDEDTIRLKGIGADANVEYDQATGKLSVDGNEIAELEAGLNITDNNYEIF
jgi:Ca2+-binding RTX toxin-like protein